MSTTLYAHIEVKFEGRWEHFAACSVYKNYLLSAAINGTRADNLAAGREIPKPAAGRTGIPADATAVTKACIAREVGPEPANACVLDAEQIQEVQDEMYRVRPEVKKTGIDQFDFEHSVFHTYINGNAIAAHTGFEDVRMICAFD